MAPKRGTYSKANELGLLNQPRPDGEQGQEGFERKPLRERRRILARMSPEKASSNREQGQDIQTRDMEEDNQAGDEGRAEEMARRRARYRMR